MNRIHCEDERATQGAATGHVAATPSAGSITGRKMKTYRCLLGSVLWACAILLLPGMASARCSGTVSTTPFSPAVVSINKNTPIGQVVASATVTLSVVCTAKDAGASSGWKMNYTPQAPLVATSLDQKTFATGMGGLGFRMYTNVGGLIAPTWYGTNGGDNFYPGGWGPGGLAPLNSTNTYTFKLDLVRTDTSLKAGTFSDSLVRFGYQFAGNDCPEGKECTRQFGNQTTTPVTFQFIDPTCAITTGTANQTVALDEARAMELPSIGSTARPKDFKVSFENCALATAVRMRMDGAPATPTVLANTGSAAGVGVQLLFKGNPLELNTTFEAGSSGSGSTLDVPFQARYFRTGGLTGGTVSSAVTITASYY
ncbi:type 1 fimbria pilin [Lysobacter sp. OAE881]|uniref:fimbrial protein n=1 Tax=Lysobacter sp. OAE881 TaxID=2663813 RepID=UPI001789A935